MRPNEFWLYMKVLHFATSWELIQPPEPIYSYGFRNEALNYTCPPVSCLESSILMRNSTVHFIAGVDHRSNFALLVFRMCEGLQWCIPPETGFKISLHWEGRDEPKLFKQSLQFLRSLQVTPDEWTGQEALFSANSKMMRYLSNFVDVNDQSRLVYHLDLDEFPDSSAMSGAVKEIENGECDAIRGYWRDRVSRTGELNQILISSQKPLTEQFPMRCNFSTTYVPARTTIKIIAYRSNLRVVSGQHALWCDIDPFVGRTGKRLPGTEDLDWDWERACTKHVNARVDKTSRASDILASFPRYTHRPRVCKTLVPIDHYKWVRGVEWYLFKRILAYKEKKLEWWRQSYGILEHINKYGGICVHCPASACIDTSGLLP